MMAGTSSYFTGSSCSIPPHRKNSHYSPIIFSVPSHSKGGALGRRFGMLTVKREPGRSKITAKPDLETASLSPSSLRPSSSSVDDEEDGRSNSAFTWFAAIGSLGFVETADMSYLSSSLSQKLRTPWNVTLVPASLAVTCPLSLKYGLDNIQKLFGSKLCITSLVVMALSASYTAVQPVSSFAATGMLHAETEITQESSPLALSLARHLQSIGAKLYGAFWCSHCVHQKQMFGHEAAKLLNYVECFPDGIEEGAKMAEACSHVQLKGFPTWEIYGQVYTGEKKFPELARLSGIELQ